jgi:hypothetical protein
MLTWLSQSSMPVAVFVEATFASETVYLWTGMGSITWNGQTWIGVGSLGGISPMPDGSTVEAKGIILTLSGFDATLLPLVLNDYIPGLPVTVYLAGFNDNVLINNPIIAWAGYLDLPSAEIAGETATLSINCESRLIEMDNAPNRRYTADDQQRDYPGDLGFSFVNAEQEKTFYWGTAPIAGQNL